MVDTGTFLATPYVLAGDFIKPILLLNSKPGPLASLSSSEVTPRYRDDCGRCSGGCGYEAIDKSFGTCRSQLSNSTALTF